MRLSTRRRAEQGPELIGEAAAYDVGRVARSEAYYQPQGALRETPWALEAAMTPMRNGV